MLGLRREKSFQGGRGLISLPLGPKSLGQAQLRVAGGNRAGKLEQHLAPSLGTGVGAVERFRRTAPLRLPKAPRSGHQDEQDNHDEPAGEFLPMLLPEKIAFAHFEGRIDGGQKDGWAR